MKTQSITKPLIAGGGAGIIDTFLLPYLTGFGLSTPIARMVAGTAGQYLIKRKGTLKNMFIAEATVGAFDLGKGLIGGMGSTATNSGKLF